MGFFRDWKFSQFWHNLNFCNCHFRKFVPAEINFRVFTDCGAYILGNLLKLCYLFCNLDWIRITGKETTINKGLKFTLNYIAWTYKQLQKEGSNLFNRTWTINCSGTYLIRFKRLLNLCTLGYTRLTRNIKKLPRLF